MDDDTDIRARLGSTVDMEISGCAEARGRVARWTLATTTDRLAGRLGVDTELGKRLLGARADDEFVVSCQGGEPFHVAVLEVLEQPPLASRP